MLWIKTILFVLFCILCIVSLVSAIYNYYRAKKRDVKVVLAELKLEVLREQLPKHLHRAALCEKVRLTFDCEVTVLQNCTVFQCDNGYYIIVFDINAIYLTTDFKVANRISEAVTLGQFSKYKV